MLKENKVLHLSKKRLKPGNQFQKMLRQDHYVFLTEDGRYLCISRSKASQAL